MSYPQSKVWSPLDFRKVFGFFFIFDPMILKTNFFQKFSKEIQWSLLNEISLMQRQPVQRIQNSITILTQNVT